MGGEEGRYSFWEEFCTVNSLCNFSKDFFGKESQGGGGIEIRDFWGEKPMKILQLKKRIV